MAHFVKGQGLVRTSFKSNVELRSANVDFVAGRYIINPRAGFAEGLSSVTVNDESIGKSLITNPASLVSVDLPAEYTAIGPKAFDGCSNLESIYIYAGEVISISEDAIPAGCTVYVDTAFLAEYQSLHPLLTFAGFDSGYTRTVPYVEGVTPTTLTAQYINDWVASLGDAKNSVGKVVVPAWFTIIENGVFALIQSSFQNMQMLETPMFIYDAINDQMTWFVPFDNTSTTLNNAYLQDKINDVRNYDWWLKVTKVYVSDSFISVASNCFVDLVGFDSITELEINSTWNTEAVTPLSSFPNLQSLYVKVHRYTQNYTLPSTLLDFEIGTLNNTAKKYVYASSLASWKIGVYNHTTMFDVFTTYQYRTPSLRTIDYGDVSNVTQISTDGNWGVFWFSTSYEVDIRWSGMKINMNLNNCNATHDGLVYIMEHAYDYSGDSGTHTWTIGSSNLNKLTQAEKDAFTAKNWTLA